MPDRERECARLLLVPVTVPRCIGGRGEGAKELLKETEEQELDE